MRVPMIAGFYRYTRDGVTHPPRAVLREIQEALVVNPTYGSELLVLAGDAWAAEVLRGFGLRVHRVFDDAPQEIHRDAAHKMKHWMCRWALDALGECLWVDWDTVMIRPPDKAFWSWCREHGTPKFVHIPGYWATVNCGVYYVGAGWRDEMDRSFGAQVPEPNDELLWRAVLPADVVDRPEFWWGDRVVQVSEERDIDLVRPGTYFAHVKELAWAERLRAAVL